jgi:hypothetical protein
MWNMVDADWKFLTTCLFVQIPEKSLLPSISTGLKEYLPVQNRAREDFRINRFSLIPLKEVGANTRNIWSSGLFPSLHPAALIAPPIMAIFILLIACFNFANTSIAIFSKRLKEIGLRKTFGGQRKQLVVQFMSETFIICFLALLVGIAISSILVPAYSNLWAYMSIELTFGRYGFFWVFLVLLLLLTGFVAGVYPAIHVSSFSPVNVLKGAGLFSGSGKLSSVLLALQFTISIMALVMGIVFAKNADYQRTRNKKNPGCICSCDNVPLKQEIPRYPLNRFTSRMCRRILYVCCPYGQYLGLFCRNRSRYTAFGSTDNDSCHHTNLKY